MWVLGCLVPSSGLVMSSCHTYNTPSNIIRTPTLDLCHNVNPHPHINTQEVSISAQNGHEHITLRNKRWGSRALTPKLYYTNTVVQHVSNIVGNIVVDVVQHVRTRYTTNGREVNNSTCWQQFHHQRTKFCHLATSGHVEMLGYARAQQCCKQRPIGTTVLTTWSVSWSVTQSIPDSRIGPTCYLFNKNVIQSGPGQITTLQFLLVTNQ